MTEPSFPASLEPEVPRPFRPEAARRPPGGCNRVALIGCGVVTLLLGVAAMVFLFKAEDLFIWAMERFEREVMQVLPDDYSEVEKRRLEQAFAAARQAVREGEADPGALQRLQQSLRESLLDGEQRLTREEVQRLLEALEDVPGGPPEKTPAGGAESGRARPVPVVA